MKGGRELGGTEVGRKKMRLSYGPWLSCTQKRWGKQSFLQTVPQAEDRRTNESAVSGPERKKGGKGEINKKN